VRLKQPSALKLIELLPLTIHIEAWRSSQTEWIQSTLRLMATEAENLKPGVETIITRLADILVIQAIHY
ncbi:MAG: AraC family transcriptional regulator, partial [bacterium]|nr:AraC family transcriptional regulator [bacterium]